MSWQKSIFFILGMAIPFFLPSQSPILYFANEGVMTEAKKAIQSGDKKAQIYFALLQTEADQALSESPKSVMDKNFLPPSGDKHDYISQGPYWWPDPSKKDGKPYIRRDGEVNPETKNFTDHTYLSALIRQVDVLAKTYFFTGAEKYAEKAIQFLRVWFLDEDTRMNPNLNYGQGIPGRTIGRGIGIIETRSLGLIIDAIALINVSKSWTQDDAIGMQVWMKAYLDWLINSEHGKDESVHPNNHGTWYDVQVCALALFTGQKSLAIEKLIQAKSTRFDEHITSSGQQPKETGRTKGWSYSTMNLLGLFHLAMLGEYLEMDLWHYKNTKGATLQDALDYLIPFTLDEKPFPFQQITPIMPERLMPHLLIADRIYPGKSYSTVVKGIRNTQTKPQDYYDLIY
jgi:hypothetical protein